MNMLITSAASGELPYTEKHESERERKRDRERGREREGGGEGERGRDKEKEGERGGRWVVESRRKGVSCG